MNTLLVAGCAVGGLIAGTALGVVAVKVQRAAKGGDPEGPLAPTSGHDVALVPDTSEASRANSEDHVDSAVTGDVADASAPADETLALAPLAPVDLSAPRLRLAIAIAAVITAGSFALAAHQFGAVPELAPYCVLFAGGVSLSLVDIRVGLLPRKILYPTLLLMVIGLLAASAINHDWRAIGDAAIGGGALFLLFGALWWFYGGMGFGDVRLAGMLGAGLGWLSLLHVYVGFLFAFAFGAIYGIVLMVAKGTGRKTKLPFGPALVAGTMVGVLWGTSLINTIFPWSH